MLKSFLLGAVLVSTQLFCFSLQANAQGGLNPNFIANSYFQDFNGNGLIEILGFGDSITRGVGDFNAPGWNVFSVNTPSQEAGYPLRLEMLAGVDIINRGVPGERMHNEGVKRFARLIPALRPDVVIIGGGSNDARSNISGFEFSTNLQTMINIARIVGVEPIIQTIPPACCDRGFLQGPIEIYNPNVRLLALINNIPLADVNRAYMNTCGGSNRCYLLNLPEGLHPNSDGYDVMGEALIATLLNIDLFTTNGQKELSEALNLPEGSFTTVPDA